MMMDQCFVVHTIDIDPLLLMSQTISVQEQVAHRIHKDLDTVMKANKNIMLSYTSKQVDACQQSAGEGHC